MEVLLLMQELFLHRAKLGYLLGVNCLLVIPKNLVYIFGNSFMKRFGVSLEDALLKDLDNLVKKHRFPNRSQAIRFLIRKNLVLDKWNENKNVSGCIVVVYDHHKRDLLNKSMTVQHKYQHLILSVQHVHLNHDNCLETIAVKGKAKQIQELANQIIGLKGIKHGELVMSLED